MNPNDFSGSAAIAKALRDKADEVVSRSPFIVSGTLSRVAGLTIEAEGCFAPLGSRCDIESPGQDTISAEVVGFSDRCLYLMPTEQVSGLKPHAKVKPNPRSSTFRMGPELLGRVIDGRGAPLDDRPPPRGEEQATTKVPRTNPLSRRVINEPINVGVRAINALFTLGRGQRVGLFAGSGVGKSMLLGMMTKHTEADVIVVGLIGERGREVSEFVRETLGEEGMRRAVVVATPADDAPLMRLNGAWLASSIAEYFRDRGQRVLLLMDSLTRFAQAQREIGLAIGEPPTTKGYPPSVFAKLPQLVERAGNNQNGTGSITAVYTVLAEGDDQNDPIVDAARAILDGHLVLSRELAEEGVFPALDIEASISRSMHRLVPRQQTEQVAALKELYASYRRNEDLVRVGAYQPGSDPSLDRALQVYPKVREFLRQAPEDGVDLPSANAALDDLLAYDDSAAGDVIPAEA